MMLKAFPEFESKFHRTMVLVSMSILNIALSYLLLWQIAITQEMIRRLLPL
jgi:hypothetical protein